MTRMLLLAALLALAACTTTGGGCYTDSEFYYWQDGVAWSCREPSAFRGGNCKPEASWPDKAKDQCRLQAVRP